MTAAKEPELSEQEVEERRVLQDHADHLEEKADLLETRVGALEDELHAAKELAEQESDRCAEYARDLRAARRKLETLEKTVMQFRPELEILLNESRRTIMRAPLSASRKHDAWVAALSTLVVMFPEVH